MKIVDKEQQPALDSLLDNLGSEHDPADIKPIYWKAFAILLESQRLYKRQGTNWTSDDDPIREVLQKPVSYRSDQDSCVLWLTNFHQRVPVDVVDGAISVEVFPKKEFPGVTNGWFRGDGEVLFTLTKHGDLISPLDLVDPPTADSIIDLFQD